MNKKYKFILTLPSQIAVDSAEEIEGHVSWSIFSQADTVRYRGIFDSYDEAKEYASKFKIYKYILNYTGYDSYEDEECYYISVFDAEVAAYCDLGIEPGDSVFPDEYTVEKTEEGYQVPKSYKYCLYYKGACVYDSLENDQYFNTYDDAEVTAEEACYSFEVKNLFKLEPVEILSIDVVGFSGNYTAEHIPWRIKRGELREYSGDDIEVTIPESVTSIGACAFSGHYSITSINMPNSVTSIGERSFEFCQSLSSIHIPSGVTEIGSLAFYCCVGLTSIEIPDGVNRIGADVFAYCPSLTSITVDENNPVYHSESNCLIETGSKTLIQGCQSSVIPSDGSVTSINDLAFCGAENLTSIVIPNTISSIGSGAFHKCESLASIELSNNITSIAPETFSSCKSITDIKIPDGVTSIGNRAFFDCTSLAAIEIPSKVAKIGFWAFRHCISLESVVISNGVTEIIWGAFQDCPKLANIKIPSSVTSIGEGVFYHCDNLVITTPADSYASEYAKKNGIKVELI